MGYERSSMYQFLVYLRGATNFLRSAAATCAPFSGHAVVSVGVDGGVGVDARTGPLDYMPDARITEAWDKTCHTWYVAQITIYCR